MKQVVVVNTSGKDFPIPELRQIMPAGNIESRHILPYDIAIKYKHFLHPIQIINDEEPIVPVNINNKELELKEAEKFINEMTQLRINGIVNYKTTMKEVIKTEDTVIHKRKYTKKKRKYTKKADKKATKNEDINSTKIKDINDAVETQIEENIDGSDSE